jgi:hypothetical protein
MHVINFSFFFPKALGCVALSKWQRIKVAHWPAKLALFLWPVLDSYGGSQTHENTYLEMVLLCALFFCIYEGSVMLDFLSVVESIFLCNLHWIVRSSTVFHLFSSIISYLIEHVSTIPGQFVRAINLSPHTFIQSLTEVQKLYWFCGREIIFCQSEKPLVDDHDPQDHSMREWILSCYSSDTDHLWWTNVKWMTSCWCL